MGDMSCEEARYWVENYLTRFKKERIRCLYISFKNSTEI